MTQDKMGCQLHYTQTFTPLNLSLLVLFENPGKGYKVAFVLLNNVKLKKFPVAMFLIS
jgi:hypothetical protein